MYDNVHMSEENSILLEEKESKPQYVQPGDRLRRVLWILRALEEKLQKLEVPWIVSVILDVCETKKCGILCHEHARRTSATTKIGGRARFIRFSVHFILLLEMLFIYGHRLTKFWWQCNSYETFRTCSTIDLLWFVEHHEITTPQSGRIIQNRQNHHPWWFQPSKTEPAKLHGIILSGHACIFTSHEVRRDSARTHQCIFRVEDSWFEAAICRHVDFVLFVFLWISLGFQPKHIYMF